MLDTGGHALNGKVGHAEAVGDEDGEGFGRCHDLKASFAQVRRYTSECGGFTSTGSSREDLL